jgi:hypothetical protein
MTDWREILAGEFAVPADLAVTELVDELVAMLGSPDPSVRDDTAYPVLAIWTGRGVIDGQLARLGDMLAGRIGAGPIYQRTFAAMSLSWVILRDATTAELSDERVLGWLGTFGSWWAGETDLRGRDADLGWLHAIAHGADLLRLAPADATGWLARVRHAIEGGEPGPVPAWAANALRTLGSLYVFADRGVAWYNPAAGALGQPTHLPHGREVKAAIADTLRLPWRGLG